MGTTWKSGQFHEFCVFFSGETQLPQHLGQPRSLEKIEAVKRELKFDLAEPESEVEPPKKPKIQQKEPKAFDDLVKVA